MTTKKIIMNFENCYGIHALDHDFDFTKTSSYAIYAPNGTMKTSFAKTLIDYTKGQKPDILPLPDIVPKLSIIDENKDEIEPKSIFVIKSEVNDFSTEKMSTLLVNKELREKYLSIAKQYRDTEKNLIDKLQKISGIKNTPKNPNNLELTLIKDIIDSADSAYCSTTKLKIYLTQKILYQNLKIMYQLLIN